MGETPLGATSWTDVGHRLGPLLRDVLDSGHGFVVIDEPGGRYVQLHAHPEGGCWVEADSGAYSLRLDAERHGALRTLGWPAVHERRPKGNYGLDLEAPVDVDRLVTLLVRTLSEAYDAEPGGLTVDVSDCGCER